MTPQSQSNNTKGALTRKAGKELDSFGEVSSAVKISAKNRPIGTIREVGLFGAPTPKLFTAVSGKKSMLMDDEEFDAMSFI